jgi:hypothetical protein
MKIIKKPTPNCRPTIRKSPKGHFRSPFQGTEVFLKNRKNIFLHPLNGLFSLILILVGCH